MSTTRTFYSFAPRRGGTCVVAAQFFARAASVDLFIYDATGQLLASSTTLGDAR